MAVKPHSTIVNSLRNIPTKTIHFDINHLKPAQKDKLLSGLIGPYDISFYSLHSIARSVVYLWQSKGYKSVFDHEGKTILLMYNK